MVKWKHKDNIKVVNKKQPVSKPLSMYTFRHLLLKIIAILLQPLNLYLFIVKINCKFLLCSL